MCWRKWISYISQRSIPKRRPGPQVTRLTQRLKPQQVRRSPTAQSPRLELKTWLQVDQRYGNLVENWLLKKKNVAYHNSIYVSIYVYMFCKFKFHGLLGASLRDKPMKAFTLRSLRSGALQELWDVKPWPLKLSWFCHFSPGWTTTLKAGMTQPIPHVEICRVEWDELGRLGKISSEPLKWKTMGEAIKIGREQQFDRHAMNHQQNEFTKRNTNQILPEQATETSYTFKTWEGEACIFFSRSATHLERPVTVMAPWIRRDRPSKSCSRPSK